MERMEWLEPVPKLEHSRLPLDKVMVDTMVVMVLPLEAVPKLGLNRHPPGTFTIIMLVMEQPDRALRPALNQVPLDKVMVTVGMPDTIRDNRPSDLMAIGRNIANRETGSVYE